MVMRTIKYAVCVYVCLFGRTFSETAERIWLKFCTGTEVCPGHCVSHFCGDRPRGPVRGAENVPRRRYCVSLVLANVLKGLRLLTAPPLLFHRMSKFKIKRKTICQKF